MEESNTGISARPALANRFRVLDTLGEGAGSAVYLVSDSERGESHVALKVLQNDQAFDEHTLERFRAEMEICKEIRHPNLVESYDLINLGDTIAFTMEYVRGTDLAELFYQPERPSPSEIDRIFIEILSALEQLHERGIVHRDLKLENILVREDGKVKLSDLGLMKRLDGEGLTRPGILLGTVHYMPPEYIKRGQYDAQSDLYSIAIMLMELVSGRRRLEGFEGREVIAELARTKFEISGAILQTLPRKYRTIVERGAARERKHRYKNAREMIQDFQRGHSEYLSSETAEIVNQVRFQSAAERHGMDKIREGKKPLFSVRSLLMLGLIVGFVAMLVIRT